jgi:hypothetical protein
MANGAKIIQGLKQAVAGNFVRVTVEGQTWVRLPDRDASADNYPSQFAMEGAVELEVYNALGRVQTQTIGKVIQRAIDKALNAKATAP